MKHTYAFLCMSILLTASCLNGMNGKPQPLARALLTRSQERTMRNPGCSPKSTQRKQENRKTIDAELRDQLEALPALSLPVRSLSNGEISRGRSSSKPALPLGRRPGSPTPEPTSLADSSESIYYAESPQ